MNTLTEVLECVEQNEVERNVVERKDSHVARGQLVTQRRPVGRARTERQHIVECAQEASAVLVGSGKQLARQTGRLYGDS